MKRLVFALIAIFCISEGHSQEFDDLTFGTDDTFEIMTWNIEWFPKNGQITIDYVAEIINALQVDVIAFQEIDVFPDFEELIEQLDGYEGYYVDDEWSGLAFAYRTEVIEVLSFYEVYTTLNREFPRPPLIFQMKYEDEPYYIINNHFKCCGDGYLDASDLWDEETRRRDASQWINELIGSYYPFSRVIVVGDLNDELTDGASNVFDVFIENPSNYLFVDTEIAEGSSSGFSYPWWPSHLDHILITNEMYNEYAQSETVVETIHLDEYILGGLAGYDANVSDHRPVALKFVSQPLIVNIDESFNNEFRFDIFPNPTTESFSLTISKSTQDLNIEIYDPQGRVVQNDQFSQGENTVNFDVSNLESGIYLVQIFNDKAVIGTERLVIY